MGLKNYLIEGVSGAGKTSVAEELERRGHHVVHGDRALAYYGDPETGEPVTLPRMPSETDSIAWAYARWIWPVDKVKALVADHSHPMTFFCGGARNAGRFSALFDKVFVLDVDFTTLSRRLSRRPDDEFGGRPIEQDFIRRIQASGEGLPREAVRIDATGPITEVVDDILARCGSGP